MTLLIPNTHETGGLTNGQLRLAQEWQRGGYTLTEIASIIGAPREAVVDGLYWRLVRSLSPEAVAMPTRRRYAGATR